MDANTADAAKASTLSASRRLLQPVVRLLLRSGITWKEFAEVAKTVFVQVATDEYGIRGRPTNLSRVSILTGINRREVARQRLLGESEQPAQPVFLNAAQRLLSAWHQDPGYLDAGGEPRAIPADGPPPSFTDLCSRYSGDLPTSALLKELRSVGAIRLNPAGEWVAAARTYIPLQMDPDKILRAGDVLNDIGTTIVYDLNPPRGEPLRFERRAENDSIDPQAVPAFRALLEQEGQAFLEKIDDWLTRHAVAQGTHTGRKPIRLGIGMYHIETESETERGRHT
jgi:hypothetical protein